MTTHLVGNRKFLEKNPDIVKNWIKGHIELTDWIRLNSHQAQQLFNQEIQKEVFQPLAPAVLQMAWKKLEVTYEPLPASIRRYGNLAFEVGLLKENPDLSNLYELKLLHEALKELQLKKSVEWNGTNRKPFR